MESGHSQEQSSQIGIDVVEIMAKLTLRREQATDSQALIASLQIKNMNLKQLLTNYSISKPYKLFIEFTTIEKFLNYNRMLNDILMYIGAEMNTPEKHRKMKEFQNIVSIFKDEVTALLKFGTEFHPIQLCVMEMYSALSSYYDIKKRRSVLFQEKKETDESSQFKASSANSSNVASRSEYSDLNRKDQDNTKKMAALCELTGYKRKRSSSQERISKKPMLATQTRRRSV